MRAILLAAGWYPGRDISGQVDEWLRGVYQEQPAAGELLPIFPVARAALAEFGDLRMRQEKPYGNPHGGFLIETWPLAGRVVLETYTDWAGTIGVRVFPFGWHEDGSSDLVVDERGRVYLLHMAANFLAGETVDDAISALLRACELSELDDNGKPVNRG